MIVEVAAERFKSKQALYEKLRGILRGHPLGSYLPETDAAFLNAALAQANEFYGYPAEAPVAWRVQCQAMGHQPEFVFLRADGTAENPSIKRLSLQKSKAGKSPRTAARQDIKSQILDFRGSKFTAGGFVCDDPDCGHVSPDGADFEVDHAEPLFSELFEGWLAEEGLNEAHIQVIEVRNNLGIMTNYGMGPELAWSFRRYHARHARLQLLCKGCHAHKTYRHAEQ